MFICLHKIYLVICVILCLCGSYIVNLNFIDIEFISIFILFVYMLISKYIVDLNYIDVKLISIHLLFVTSRYFQIDSITKFNIC